MKTAILLLILAALIGVGGFLIFFSGDIDPTPPDTTTDSANEQQLDPDTNTDSSIDTNNDDNESNSDPDNNSNSFDDDSDFGTGSGSELNFGSDSDTARENGVEQLPNTAIISDEVDLILGGLALIFISIYLLKTGILYNFVLNSSQRVFGIDLTNFDYENANWIEKKVYEKMVNR
jgi:hypothetical protein